jgi:outer membrane receptor protein involved in Fe transport
MSYNDRLRRAWRVAVCSTVVVACGTPMAFAQDAESATDDPIDEIVVTGSHIKRPDLDSASPITIVHQQDILTSGVTNVAELIQRLASMTGAVNTTTQNGNDGSASVSLHGWGSTRTLVLINGKRMVQPDFQTIPAGIIERVEILRDGASAIYGGDAISGVVNVITRQDMNGVEINAQHNDWSDSKGMQSSISAVAGKNFDRGNVLFGAEYVDQEHAYQKDAPWDFFQDTYYIFPTGCEHQITAPFNPGDPENSGCWTLGSSRIPESRLRFLNQGQYLIDDQQVATQPYEVGGMIPHDGRNYNYAPANYIQMPYQRINLWAQGSYEINESVTLSAEFRRSQRKTSAEFAPLPFDSSQDPAYSGVFNGQPYNGISEDNYYLRRAVDAYNANPANAGSPLVYEPVGLASRRIIEMKRGKDFETTQTQAVISLAGQFGEVDWEVFINKGQWDISEDAFGLFYGPRVSNALGPSADLDGDGRPECYADINDPGTFIAGCVPLNLFGGGTVDEQSTPVLTTLTDDMLDYVSNGWNESTKNTQDQAGFGLTGSAFTLPAGEAEWAAGYEYRYESLSRGPVVVTLNDSAFEERAGSSIGSYMAHSVYGEAFLPLFDNDSQSFDLKMGIRWEDFSSYGNQTTYQLGAEFGVIQSVKLRGTYGTVFSPPGIMDLYAPLAPGFSTYKDPCDPTNFGGELAPGCNGRTTTQADSQVPTLRGGNPLLEAEEGETLTAGIVWTPEFGGGGLSVVLDYWQVKVENIITRAGVQSTLNNCYRSLHEDSCALITRRPADFSVGQVIDGSVNLSRGTITGLDAEIIWSFDSAVGTWDTSLSWSRPLKSSFGYIDDEPEEDDPSSEIDYINYSIAWNRNDFGITYTGQYIGSKKPESIFFDYYYDIPSRLFQDVTFRYELVATGTQFSAGITNLTDEAPPFVEEGSAVNTSLSYRLFGRGYFLGITQRFE